MITIKNSVFSAQGTNRKDAVYGLTLNGHEDVLVKDCKFENMGYAGVLNHCEGNVTVDGCEFACANIYNPIEGSQKVDNGNVVVKDCAFKGAPGNNYINFYQFADNSKHEISGCSFEPTVDNNIVRISNRTSAKAEFLAKNCNYVFADGEATEYTNFLLCQDYTMKNGVKQDFTGVKVTLEDVACNGEKITAEAGPVKGGVFYVYQDGTGVITGQENDPVVVVK